MRTKENMERKLPFLFCVNSRNKELVFVSTRAIAFVQKHAEDTYWSEIHMLSGRVVFCTEEPNDIYEIVMGEDYYA